MKIFNKFIGHADKICVVAEKYSAALEYAKALGCEKKESYFANKKYVIVWTDGHLCTLYNPEDYDSKYKKWDKGDLPIFPNGFWIKVRRGKGEKIKLIKEIINRDEITAVCIATDSAREGNLIGEYLLMAIDNKKKVYRAMINALNKKEITEGFKDMKEDKVYRNMTLAAQARDEVDWLIGTNLSRAYSLTFSKKYYVGRCKTVILSLLCKRENEISTFRECVSYGILANFSNERYEYVGRMNSSVNSIEESNRIVEDIKNKPGKVSDISKEVKVVAPDELYNLNDLIRAVNRRYGYSSDLTYDIAQKLYEDHKLISYSRTDCRSVKASMMNDIKMTLSCINFGSFKEKISDIKEVKGLELFRSRCVNDEKVIEHTAIIPLPIDSITLQHEYSSLSLQEKNIYDLIVENFIDNFLDDNMYESISITTNVEKYDFTTRFQRTIEPGWRNAEKNLVPSVNKGDLVRVEDTKIEKKLSKPKARYNEDTLFELLENPGKFVEDINLKRILKESGIGTNATRALLIKDLIKNGYVVRDNKLIIPTIEGQELIKVIKTDKLLEPYFTAEVEQQLQKIQDGKLSKDELIKATMKFIEEHIEDLKAISSTDCKSKAIGKCPICKSGNIVPAGTKGYGCTNLKRTGCRFYVSREISGAYIDENQVKKLISKGETDILNFNGKSGSFAARIVIKDGNTKFKKA